jgi:hypothetical protein
VHWYFSVPGVTTNWRSCPFGFGCRGQRPFNQHFIRDIGLIFLFVGTAPLLGVAKPQYLVVLWAAPTLWLAAHALFHFWEVAVGICAPSVLLRDFPPSRSPHHRHRPDSLGSSRLRIAEHAHTISV